ncbi:unnamed protein product [Toxocara canis]|uniref:Equilibrative nucleoside transporter 1 n=1 Tax=Toxocara canis TaxID=6265 RepID=A0A183UWX2_TOXCA|nr:unnamed protein product [Toxocara canis]
MMLVGLDSVQVNEGHTPPHVQYFHYKLRNVTEDMDNASSIDNRTELQKSYEGWVTITSSTSCIIGAAFNLLTTDRLSNSFRVISGHVTVLISLIPTVALTFIYTDYVQELFFWFSMFLAALASLGSTGLLGCGLLGYSARFPAVYMQAVMLGQSVAGILSSLLSIFCQAFTSNSLLNGRVFFIIATLWTLASAFVYIWLVRSPNTIIIMNSEDVQSSNVEQSRSLLLDADENTAYFTAIACFLLFNVGDAVGRLLFYAVPLEGRLLLMLSLSRFALVPLLLLCNVYPRSHSETLFHNDAIFILLMALFALSNGLFFTSASVSATRKVDEDLRELTGSLIGMVAMVSSLMGSIFGALLVMVV